MKMVQCMIAGGGLKIGEGMGFTVSAQEVNSKMSNA